MGRSVMKMASTRPRDPLLLNMTNAAGLVVMFRMSGRGLAKSAGMLRL